MNILDYSMQKLSDRYSPQAYQRLDSSFRAMRLHEDKDLAKVTLMDFCNTCKAMGGIQLNMLRELGVPGKVSARKEDEMKKCRENDVRALRKLVEDMWDGGDFSHWGAWHDYTLEDELERLGFDVG